MKKFTSKKPGLFIYVCILSILVALAGIICFCVFVEDNIVNALIILAAALAKILLLQLHFVISIYFYRAATEKGYDDTFYLNLAFFLPPVGYALIIALPDRGNSIVQQAK